MYWSKPNNSLISSREETSWTEANGIACSGGRELMAFCKDLYKAIFEL